MAYTGEYTNKSPSQIATLREFKDALQISQDFTKPYFERFVRFYRLFQGNTPPDIIDTTFSKIMLQIAYSMIENELPRSARGLFTSEWFNLEADSPEYEIPSNIAEKWLRYQMETRQNIQQTIIPTIQSVHIFGTGYRVYYYRNKNKTNTKRAPAGDAMGIPYGFSDIQNTESSGIISGQYASVFDIYPSPTGCYPNELDDSSMSCADWVIWTTYAKESAIKEEVEKGNFDRAEAARMMQTLGSSGADPSDEYKNDIASTKSMWSNFTTPEWIRQIRERNKSLSHRYRLNWYFKHDRWICIGEDNFVLYDGEPVIDAIPVAKFTAGYDLDNWYGKGLIEISEDIILSIILNFNHRFDYLAETLHPPTWIPERIFEHFGSDKTAFDPEPYSVLPYPDVAGGKIRDLVFHDRYPDIPQQAFVEEGKLDEFLQKVTGQPNYGKGMGGAGALGNETATGITNLISEGTARSMMRSMNIEYSGIRESLGLTLKFGKKFKNDDEYIRRSGIDGFPWELIPGDNITDMYGIKVSGTKTLNMAEDTFKKMLATLPSITPMLAQPKLAAKQLMDLAGWKSIDNILGVSEGNPSAPLMVPQQTPGVGGVPTPQNDMRSVMNRTTVNPQGEQIAAGNAIV